eukprot:31071-Pelagococcus_subviridis.AAC.14
MSASTEALFGESYPKCISRSHRGETSCFVSAAAAGAAADAAMTTDEEEEEEEEEGEGDREARLLPRRRAEAAIGAATRRAAGARARAARTVVVRATASRDAIEVSCRGVVRASARASGVSRDATLGIDRSTPRSRVASQEPTSDVARRG